MKYLAKVCTSALTFGLLMVGGSAAASAHQVNANQNQGNGQQNTEVTNNGNSNNNEPKTYPLYHFRNNQNHFILKNYVRRVNNLQSSVVLPKHRAHHFHYNAVNPQKSVKLASINNNNSDHSEDNKVSNSNSDQNNAKIYSYKGNIYTNRDSYRAARFSNSRIGKLASTKLGDPYVWGATGANAFDCSGFTQYLYRNAKHINLPRTAQAQYDYERHVSYNHIKPGDLVFFGYSPRAIAHVGMYIGNGKMIDAQNRGVITEYVKAPWWNLVGCARVRHNLDLD